MTYLTPDQAVIARKTLNLSQAKVAKDTGINRAYLSEFEGSHRVLEDRRLVTLFDYYVGNGWEPGSDDYDVPVKQLLDSDKHDLTIIDGFVVAPKSFTSESEVLLDEYYTISQELLELKLCKLKRGLFGWLDESEALKKCVRPLVLMSRQYEIIQILHGQLDSDYSGVDRGDTSTVQTVGDYLEAQLQGAIPDRLIPVSSENEMAECSVDAVA